jgi:putative transposase
MPRLKAYRFRLQPGSDQETLLFGWSSALRFLWNWMLAQRRDAYQASEGRVSVTYHAQAAQLVPMKEIFPWLGLAPSQSLQQLLLQLDQAFRNFFESRARYPEFKRRQDLPCGIRWPQGVRINGRCVFLPKLGWVKARLPQKVSGTIKNATERFDGLHWYVSIEVEQQVQSVPAVAGSTIGIDLGVEESLALSDSSFVRLPVATAGQERRLATLARRISRCRPGSRRHALARRRRLVSSRSIKDRTGDSRHKATTRLAKNHGRIVVEDLSIKALTRSGHGSMGKPGSGVAAKTALNRAFLEQGHAETIRQLGYKLSWLGRELIRNHAVGSMFSQQMRVDSRLHCNWGTGLGSSPTDATTSRVLAGARRA